MPRPLSPITATTTRSFGELLANSDGTRDVASAPRPTAEALRKSRRWTVSLFFISGSGKAEGSRSAQRSNLDVAEVYLVAVILQYDVTRAPIGEMRDPPVLALREQRIHARRSKIEIDDLAAVEPVLAVIAAKDQPRGVPLSHGHEPLTRVRRD